MTSFGAEPAQAVYIGLNDLTAPGSDEIALISLGLPDVPSRIAVTPLVLDRAQTGGGGVGGDRESEDTGIKDFERLLQPLAGYVIRPAREPVQILVRLVARTPGIVEFHRFTLTFSVGGGPPQTEEFPQGGMICYGTGLSLTSCPETPSSTPGRPA